MLTRDRNIITPWDPEGDAIASLQVVAGDTSPSWLSIRESELHPGTWILGGTPAETDPTEYSFRIRAEDTSGGTDRIVKLKVITQ